MWLNTSCQCKMDMDKKGALQLYTMRGTHAIFYGSGEQKKAMGDHIQVYNMTH